MAVNTRKDYTIYICFTIICSLFIVSCATTSGVDSMKEAEKYYNLGVADIERKDLQKASIEFHKALQYNPRDKNSLNMLGYISARFKEYDEAVSYYERAISIDPDFSDALNNLAVAYMDMGDWDNAVKYFGKSLENPLYASPEKAYLGMGLAYFQKKDYVNAEKVIKKAIVRFPTRPEPMFRLGLIYMKLGRTQEAIDSFKRTLSIVPDHIDTHWQIANAYMRLGNREMAVAHFKVVVDSSSDEQQVREALGYIRLLKE